jgi:hypothetical protein
VGEKLGFKGKLSLVAVGGTDRTLSLSQQSSSSPPIAYTGVILFEAYNSAIRLLEVLWELYGNFKLA